jgi:hypothetical protein
MSTVENTQTETEGPRGARIALVWEKCWGGYHTSLSAHSQFDIFWMKDNHISTKIRITSSLKWCDLGDSPGGCAVTGIHVCVPGNNWHDSVNNWPDSVNNWPDSVNNWPDSVNNWPDSVNNWPDSVNNWPDSGAERKCHSFLSMLVSLLLGADPAQAEWGQATPAEQIQQAGWNSHKRGEGLTCHKNQLRCSTYNNTIKQNCVETLMLWQGFLFKRWGCAV